MGPKDKKKLGKKDAVPEIIPIFEEPKVEEEQEHIEYTDTSYTSASWEDVPPLPVVEEKKPKKKKKGGEEVKKEGSGDLFQWSEASFGEDAVVEEPKPPEPPPEKKEKKKGKKGKEDKEEIPDFEKPKEYRTWNPKQQAEWMKQRIEQWRHDVEAEKQAKLAGAKEKRLREAREREERMARELEAMEIRRDLLQKTCKLMRRYELQKKDYDNSKQIQAEWSQYLRCDGLPDPRVVTQMATFLHVWIERGLYDDDELDRKCSEVLPMLEMLEEFVANARQYTEQQAHNYNEVRLQLRAQLAHAIEFASYAVLRNLMTKMKWPSIKLCTYQRVFSGLKLNLWVAVRMPHGQPRVKKEDDFSIDEPVELEFPGIQTQVTLPVVVDATDICVRASRSEIDLLSELSKTFSVSADLADRYEDLFTFNVKEFVVVMKKKAEQDTFRKGFFKAIRERMRELETIIKANVYAQLPDEKEELEKLTLMEPPFMPEPRDWAAEENETAFKKYLRSCNLRVRGGELNLRKYRICGGVLYLDLLVPPPQSKNMEYGIDITTLQLPKALRWVNYKVQYKTPPTPEGLEEAELANFLAIIEEDYKKLAHVRIELSHEIIWNEQPIVNQWQEQRKLWTSNYINDLQYDEKNLVISFRTGVLWPIGLGCLKYCNLPYQSWDIRPDPRSKSGIIVEVQGCIVKCTWKIIGNSVKLIFVANASTLALRPYYNKKFTVKGMVQLMREKSCDFFPDFDAHNHVEGTTPKEWVMERHLYHAMAFLSRAYNFQWSKWNLQVGFRKIAVQMREMVDVKRESKLNILLATPQMATVLKNSENMKKWDEEPMAGMKFYTDLFTLNLQYGSIDARRISFQMKYKVVETLFNFLQELKLCSFSCGEELQIEEEEAPPPPPPPPEKKGKKK